MRIFSLNSAKVIACLEEAAARLAEKKQEIMEMWLFGSLARGDAVPGSDADVLVILTESEKPFHERGLDYALDPCGVGVDLFAYTAAEFADLRETRPRFHLTLMNERKLLYRRDAA